MNPGAITKGVVLWSILMVVAMFASVILLNWMTGVYMQTEMYIDP